MGAQELHTSRQDRAIHDEPLGTLVKQGDKGGIRKRKIQDLVGQEDNNMSEIYMQRAKLRTWWGRERTG